MLKNKTKQNNFTFIFGLPKKDTIPALSHEWDIQHYATKFFTFLMFTRNCQMIVNESHT